MFFPTRLFCSNVVPVKPHRAVSSSVGTISVILLAIAIAVLLRQASAAAPQRTLPYVQVQDGASALYLTGVTSVQSKTRKSLPTPP
jgi:hypothetical protein